MQMRTLTMRIAAVLALMLTVGCSRADWRKTPLVLQPLSSPVTGNGTSPQMTVSDKGLILSWVERAGEMTTLKFAERSSSGWTAPTTVTSGDVFVNYADVPSVIRMSDGTLAAHWSKETDAAEEAYDLLLSYSKDNGKTWSPPFSPHHDGTITQHAFATLLELPAKGLGVIWLDGRGYELDHGDAMSVRYAAFDTSWKQTADEPIDARACECCPTTAVVTADGVLTAFRNRTELEVRDIYTSRLENGKWTEGRTVHDDGWKVAACPVNGPMLSARGRDAVVAWFTVKNDIGEAYAAFSSDAGNTWGNPIRLDDGSSLGRVDVELLDDGSAVASYVEFADKKAQIRVRRLERSGMKSPAATVAGASASATSGYQRMARMGDDLVFAWAESAAGEEDAESAQQIKTAVAQIPR